MNLYWTSDGGWKTMPPLGVCFDAKASSAHQYAKYAREWIDVLFAFPERIEILEVRIVEEK